MKVIGIILFLFLSMSCGMFSSQEIRYYNCISRLTRSGIDEIIAINQCNKLILHEQETENIRFRSVYDVD